MVIDYQYLNKETIYNSYLLLLISLLINKLKGSDIYMKMDLCWGYNYIYIKDGHEWKSAFVISIGFYELVVMFFGMCNSLSIFQQMMNVIFSDEMHEGFLVIYMDDLMIFTCGMSQAEHVKLVKRILQKLQENDLFVKPSTCMFLAKSVYFLRMTMSK